LEKLFSGTDVKLKKKKKKERKKGGDGGKIHAIV